MLRIVGGALVLLVLVVIVPRGGGAQMGRNSADEVAMENRIALLEQQVANLQARVRVVDLSCASGQIAGFLDGAGPAPAVNARLSWRAPLTENPDSALSYLHGEGSFQGCTLTASP